MPTIVEDVIAKTQVADIDSPPKEEKLNGKERDVSSVETQTKAAQEEQENKKVQESKAIDGKEPHREAEKEEVPVQVEPKTGVSFPIRLDDGKQLKAAGLRKKSMLGLGIKIYGFGIYADNQRQKDILTSKFERAPAKATKEMYQMVIDSDLGMMVQLVIVFSSLTMSMVRKNFDEGLGASIKKLTGGKNEELTKKIMGEASDDIKLTTGSVIEISRLPGYILQTRVKGDVVSSVERELLCRAYIHMYLGDDPFDKEAKEILEYPCFLSSDRE
ncbi:hypothetical protein RJ639_035710, partial [Escallonia herrerae]